MKKSIARRTLAATSVLAMSGAALLVGTGPASANTNGLVGYADIVDVVDRDSYFVNGNQRRDLTLIRIVGWACNPTNPGLNVGIHIYADGDIKRDNIVANGLRDDPAVASACGGNSNRNYDVTFTLFGRYDEDEIAVFAVDGIGSAQLPIING